MKSIEVGGVGARSKVLFAADILVATPHHPAESRSYADIGRFEPTSLFTTTVLYSDQLQDLYHEEDGVLRDYYSHYFVCHLA